MGKKGYFVFIPIHCMHFINQQITQYEAEFLWYMWVTFFIYTTECQMYFYGEIEWGQFVTRAEM